MSCFTFCLHSKSLRSGVHFSLTAHLPSGVSQNFLGPHLQNQSHGLCIPAGPTRIPAAAGASELCGEESLRQELEGMKLGQIGMRSLGQNGENTWAPSSGISRWPGGRPCPVEQWERDPVVRSPQARTTCLIHFLWPFYFHLTPCSLVNFCPLTSVLLTFLFLFLSFEVLERTVLFSVVWLSHSRSPGFVCYETAALGFRKLLPPPHSSPPWSAPPVPEWAESPGPQGTLQARGGWEREPHLKVQR